MVEIKIEKNWQAVSILVGLAVHLIGAASWGVSVYLELRDSRIAQQQQLRTVVSSVDRLSDNLKDLSTALANHEKRISIHDVEIQNLKSSR